VIADRLAVRSHQILSGHFRGETGFDWMIASPWAQAHSTTGLAPSIGVGAARVPTP
jgi:hypothetical protein